MTEIRGRMNRAFTRVHALAAGYEEAQIRALLRRGHWVALRRGVYVTADDLAAVQGDPVQAHALRCAAVLLALTPRYMAAGASAARLHGFHFLNDPPEDVVLLTHAPVVHGIRRDGYLLRQAPVPASHRWVRHEVPLTSPERTLLDLASELPFVDAVVLVDSALHRGVVGGEALEEILASAVGRPGVDAARRSLRFGDPASESPLESTSRALFHLYGLPPPQTQVSLRLRSGRVVRADFLWDGRVLGEADGLSKYTPQDGRSTLDVLRAEKARENDMRDDGYEVVRWGWREVNQPDLLAARVLAAMSRAAERRRGRAC